MEYIWLSICAKVDYLTYINLLKVFKNINNIYVVSKNKDMFLKSLKLNNIYIKYEIYSNLISSNLKVKANEIYLDISYSNIIVINIDSKYYPVNLLNIYNPPIVLFAYGDISLLKYKKVYVYNSNRFSVNGKKSYNEFCKYMNKYNIMIVSELYNEYSNIIYLPYLQNIGREDVLVISDKLEGINDLNYELIAGLSDCLFITEANYNIKIAIIVDLILEQGKDVLVVPGSIYNKEAYFSNYLIKDGAICITSKVDLLNYFD